MLALLGDSADWKEFGDFYKKAVGGGTLFEQTRSAPVQTSRRMDWDGHRRGADSLHGDGRAAARARPLAFGARREARARLIGATRSQRRGGTHDVTVRQRQRVIYARADAGSRGVALAKRGLRVRIDGTRWPGDLEQIDEHDAGDAGSHPRRENGARRIQEILHAARRSVEPRARERARDEQDHWCWGSWHGPHAHDRPLAESRRHAAHHRAQPVALRGGEDAIADEHEYASGERVDLREASTRGHACVVTCTSIAAQYELPSSCDRIGESRSRRREKRLALDGKRAEHAVIGIGRAPDPPADDALDDRRGRSLPGERSADRYGRIRVARTFRAAARRRTAAPAGTALR